MLTWKMSFISESYTNVDQNAAKIWGQQVFVCTLIYAFVRNYEINSKSCIKPGNSPKRVICKCMLFHINRNMDIIIFHCSEI